MQNYGAVVELVGLHVGEVSTPTPKQIRLTPASVFTKDMTARLVAIDVANDSNYRLDAEVSEKAPILIESAPVLIALKIDVRNVAFLATIATDATNTYVPMQLGADRSERVIAILVATDPLRRLRVALLDEQGSRVQKDTVIDGPSVRTPLRIPIQRGEQARTLLLLVTPLSPFSDEPMPARTYRLFVPGMK